jgi:hypothetical protein
VDFGQINITTGVSMLSAHNDLPQGEEHSPAASSFIYYYLKTWSNVRLIPNTGYEASSQENRMELLVMVVDGAIPLDALRPLGQPVKYCHPMDADHAHAGDRFKPNQ